MSSSKETFGALLAFGMIGLAGAYLTTTQNRVDTQERELALLEQQRERESQERARQEQMQARKREMSQGSEYVELTLAKEDNMKTGIIGRVLIRLHTTRVPNTCENFRQLAQSKRYNKTPFHRVIQGFMIQGGDFTKGDGTGGESIFGPTFPDENLEYTHDKPGLLSMANSGPDTNGSQFFITTVATPHLDGKHVVFGEVVEGMEFVHDIEREMTDNRERPIRHCYIETARVVEKPTQRQNQPPPESQPNPHQHSQQHSQHSQQMPPQPPASEEYQSPPFPGSNNGGMEGFDNMRMGMATRGDQEQPGGQAAQPGQFDQNQFQQPGQNQGQGDGPMAMEAPIPHANPEYGSPL